MEVFFERRMARASAWDVSLSPLEQMRMCSFSECRGGGEFVEDVFEVCVGIEVLRYGIELCRESEGCVGGDCGRGLCVGVGGCGCVACFEFS